MKKQILIGWAVVAILVIAGVVGFNYKSAEAPNPVLDAFKAEFMPACTEDGVVSYSRCECMYNFLLSHYGEKGLMALDLEYRETRVMPKEIYAVMADAAYQCK